jgi:hypothetical protein
MVPRITIEIDSNIVYFLSSFLNKMNLFKVKTIDFFKREALKSFCGVFIVSILFFKELYA